MQSEVALSTTKAEYIAMSKRARDLIPIMDIIQCINEFIKVDNKGISTYSKVFEDNAGALHLATKPKYRPRKKHICVKYHHFRQYIKNKIIYIKAISINDQQEDIFTKPLAYEKFVKFYKAIMG